MGVISSLTGEYSFLSNKYMVGITLGNTHYTSAEQLYQVCKMKDKSLADIFSDISGDEIKRIGEYITPRNDWDSVKDTVLYLITKEKFSQNPVLAEKLIDTGDTEIEDEFLGDILMRVRRELANKR